MFRNRTGCHIQAAYAVHWQDTHKYGIDIDKVRAENPWAVGVRNFTLILGNKKSPATALTAPGLAD